MRLIGGVVLTIIFWLIVMPGCIAATSSSQPLLMGADVLQSLSISVILRKNEWGDIVTSMDFGKLVDIGTGTLRSSATSTTGTGAVCAFVRAVSPGAPYIISQTGTALSNGLTTLPAGACTVVPVYVTTDNGGASIPSGASLGNRGTWVESGKVLYTSDPFYSSRTIRCYYSITDDPAAGSTAVVPMNQQGGTYQGTVVFTITTN